jgi:hypothetical protein
MKNILIKIAAIIAAIILLQTLYFKFTAQPESVYIFTQLGLEPHGRIGSGIFELITGILLLLPKTRIYVLGFEVRNDGGELFYLALTVFSSCLFILISERKMVIELFKKHLKI